MENNRASDAQYEKLAMRACLCEREKQWRQANYFWSQAINVAYGVNRVWAINRANYCRRRVRSGESIKTTDMLWLNIPSFVNCKRIKLRD